MGHLSHRREFAANVKAAVLRRATFMVLTETMASLVRHYRDVCDFDAKYARNYSMTGFVIISCREASLARHSACRDAKSTRNLPENSAM